MIIVSLSRNFVALLCVFITISSISADDSSTLKYVNAVFRHGDRTFAKSEIFPKDGFGPEITEPFGVGQLTNEGKRRAYKLGGELKIKYGKFLGKMYKVNLIGTRSTEVDRTRMTLQLVLSSLFTPTNVEVWNPHLAWQPIPDGYVPLFEDNMLMPTFVCDKYRDVYNQVLQTPQVQKTVANYTRLMKFLSEKTGSNVKTLLNVFSVGSSLKVRKEMSISPSWVNDAVLKDIREASIAQFYLNNFNKTLIKRSGGILLSRMIKSMENLMHGNNTEKLYLYSSHDVNVISILFALNVFKPHVPDYTSCVILELHQIKGVYYVKVIYYQGIPSKMIELQIPGCQVLCSYRDFIRLVRDNLPSKEDICGEKIIDDRLEEIKKNYNSRVN